ncbi:MAG: hypothetical protein K9G48_05375 [Reyranella sp.]|nr:hypothetical protein [Reyranella sp.]
MPTREELLALADRVEREGPNFALEIEIECKVFGYTRAGSQGMVFTGLGQPRPPRPFTVNRDQAAALADPTWIVHRIWQRIEPGNPWSVRFSDPPVGGNANTEAAARCAAALRGLAVTLP